MLKTFGLAHTFRIKHKWAKNFSIHLEVSQYMRLKIYRTFQNSDQCVLQDFDLEMDGDLLSPVRNVEDFRPKFRHAPDLFFCVFSRARSPDPRNEYFIENLFSDKSVYYL